MKLNILTIKLTIVLFIASLIVVACQPQTVEVIVTEEVIKEVEVEVTRQVIEEVIVTQEVEVEVVREPVTFLALTRNQPETLDPAVGSSNPTFKVFVGLYEPLIDHKLGTADVDNLQGVLAEDWEISDDGLVYTFYLRDGVKFHDGTDLDAQDVVVTFERMKAIGLGRSYLLELVKEVREVDPLTVEIELTAPFAPFLLSLPLIYIVSEDAVAANEENGDYAQEWFNTNEAGSGPYTLGVYKIGDEVQMNAFPDYWGGWSGEHLDRIILKLIPEAATQRIMMEADQGQWADTISPGDLKEMENDPRFVVTNDSAWAVFWLMMDTNQPPTDDPRVREALRLAFPYQDMLDNVRLGYGSYPEGYLPPTFLSAVRKPEVADLDRARELFEEAGVGPGTTLTLTYFNGFDWERQGAELLAANLQQFGINVEINAQPWASMLELITNPEVRPHLAYFSAGPSTADPDSTFTQTFACGSTHWSNYGYCNEEVDALLDEARVETDVNRRIELYEKVQEILQEDSPAINTLVGSSTHVLRSNIKGYVYHPPYIYGPIEYYPLSIEQP
jgi:peptide/nickel transport system substrate-binding protein